MKSLLSDELLDLLKNSQTYQSLIKEIKEFESDPQEIWLKGICGAAKAQLLSALLSDLKLLKLKPNPSKCLAILPSEAEAENLFQDLKFFSPNKQPVLFPEPPSLGISGLNDLNANKRILAQRIAVLEQLLVEPECFVITSIKAIMYKIPATELLRAATFKLEVGLEIQLQKFIADLVKFGYLKVDIVESKGEFALRGGIIDVFPLTSNTPIRIELFGDQVDSIREFDLASQRSTKKLENLRIPPADDQTLYNYDYDYDAGRRTKGEGQNLVTLVTLIDYLPEGSLIFFCEPLWASKELDRALDQAEVEHHRKAEGGRRKAEININTEGEQGSREAGEAGEAEEKRSFTPASPASPAPHQSLTSPFADFQSIIEVCQKHKLIYATLSQHVGAYGDTPLPKSFHFDFRPLSGYRGNFQALLEQMKTWKSEGKRLIILSDNERQAERLSEILLEREIEGITVSLGEISDGFFSDSLALVLSSEDEIFSRRRIYRNRRRARFSKGISITNFSELKVGDYMVHISHGIGKYEGLKSLNIDGKSQDFLALRYAEGDLLYVPTYQLDMVQKYVGGEEGRVKLDKLGGGSWQRTKKRVKESAQKLAKELLELYATREALEGYAFSANTPWQKEFEAAFPYEETPDQLRAIEDVKMDLEKPKPMDRLICGDVGYGKTEVAMRAAFKAVMDGKQVAVLVPTTVLAQQHYHTFSERFKEYPIKIEMLSRFKTPQEQKETTKELSEGKVDVIIGTHRLLQKDVKFHDLGLLVIDEEHRFGVEQKEKLKQFRKLVDVMTLTATPIPRTLHMALSGARDMSIINTPPENRLPIETYLMPYKSEIVKDAIKRELDRGGQIFFVHNRIQNIMSLVKSIQTLVPQARIAMAHGRMPERQLEQIMIDFVNYQYDILVCTTIIESGLDIPNVNTIIINRADALGLAQLYQLRGRVGRDRYKAYGYLLYPEDRAITENSQKRLRAIEEFTDLGSGFKIALRDLEIRGTGNILGPEQHGHIAAVGYEMYCKILEEAIKELKGEEVTEKFETKINLSLEAYLPDEYIPDNHNRLKMDIYKKLSEAQSEAEIEDLEAELKDRFGQPPTPVRNLLGISNLKRLAQKLGIDAIISSGDAVKVSFEKNYTTVDPRKLINLIRADERLSLSPPVRLMIKIDSIDQKDGLKVINTVKEILEKIQ